MLEALSAPDAAKQAVSAALSAAGHRVSQEIDADAIQALGTASAQLASAIDAAAGSTVVLITTTLALAEEAGRTLPVGDRCPAHRGQGRC